MTLESLCMLAPGMPAVTHPWRVEARARLAVGLLALVSHWVMVDVLVFTTAAQNPRTFSNNKKEFSTLAAIATKVFLIMFSVSMPTQAP